MEECVIKAACEREMLLSEWRNCMGGKKKDVASGAAEERIRHRIDEVQERCMEAWRISAGLHISLIFGRG